MHERHDFAARPLTAEWVVYEMESPEGQGNYGTSATQQRCPYCSDLKLRFRIVNSRGRANGDRDG